jgi:hypothetical protein
LNTFDLVNLLLSRLNQLKTHNEFIEMLESPTVTTEAETLGNETVRRHVKDALKSCKEHEQEMKDMMTQLIHSSKSNYRFKASANSILVIIGTILIASPVVFTWLKSTGQFPSINGMDLTNLNYFLGGIGIVAFVTTFYNKPQRQMAIAIGDLAQMLLICNMYSLQFHALAGRLDKESINDKGLSSKQVMDGISKDLYNITKDAAELIDNYIEKYARSDRQGRRGKNSSKKEVNTTKESINNNEKAFR